MSQTTFYDTAHEKFVITEEFCESCHISRDGNGRQGVKPYAVACYVYRLMVTLHKRPAEVYNTLISKWDGPFWGNSSIGINTWNQLFNDSPLSEQQWRSIRIHPKYIDLVVTNLTTLSEKKPAHFMRMLSQSDPQTLYVCSDLVFNSFVKGNSSSKGTFYEYGRLKGFTKFEDLYESLRNEVKQVTIPFMEYS